MTTPADHDQQPRRTLPARALRSLPFAGLVTAVVVAVVQLAPAGQERLVTGLTALVLATVTVVTRATYRLLVPRVGTATAWAGLVVLWAALVGGFFAISPDCYTGLVPQRCDTRELATWTVVGALLPLIALVGVFLPYRLLRAAGHAARLGYRLTRMDGPTAGPAPARHSETDGTVAGTESNAEKTAARSGDPAVRATAKKTKKG